MNYNCFKCSRVIPGPLRELTIHLRHTHAIIDGSRVSIVCGQDGCLQTFNTVSSLRRHIGRLHRSCGDLINDIDEDLLMDLPVDAEAHDAANIPVCSLPFATEAHAKICAREQACRFAATLKSRASVTEATVSLVVNNTMDLVRTVVDRINNDLQQYIEANNINLTNQQKLGISAIMEENQNPFEGVETAYLRDQYFLRNFNFLEPHEHVLGTRYGSHVSKRNLTLRQNTFVNALYYIFPGV